MKNKLHPVYKDTCIDTKDGIELNTSFEHVLKKKSILKETSFFDKSNNKFLLCNYLDGEERAGCTMLLFIWNEYYFN